MGLSHVHVGPKILAKIQIYILIRADLLLTLCSEMPCSAKPAQVGADYPRANDRTIFWPMLAHSTADRQQLGSSPGFTFQEVGVCVVPMNQEETRSLEIFDIVYSAFKPIHAEPTVQCMILPKDSLSQLSFNYVQHIKMTI